MDLISAFLGDFNMTYEKKIKILSGIIVLLLASYITGTIFSSANINRRRTLQPIFDKVIFNKISAIRIDIEDGDLFIQKEEGNKWFYTYNGKKYPASVDRIENFIDSVSRLTKHQIVGSNSRIWEKFDLVEGKSKDAIFYDSSNNELFSLYIGKTGPATGSGEYIRTSLSDEVYLLEASIARYFMRDTPYWSSHRVLPEDVDSNTITAVKIITDQKFRSEVAMLNFSMRREIESNRVNWKDMPSGKVIDRNSADMLLNNIASFTADSFSESYITEKNAEIEIETDYYGRIIIDIEVLGEYNVLFGIRGGDYMHEASLFKIERILNSIERIIGELE